MKNKLRKVCIQKRKSVSCKEKDIKIIQNLFSMVEFSTAKNILAYYPLKYEPDLKECFILNGEKNWYLPRVNGMKLDICEYNPQMLSSGSFNITEPQTPGIDNYSIIDMVITPAIAADKNGYRLGYGKGYYDRLFPELKKDCIKVYIVYEELVLSTIYPDKNDIKGNFIVSEKHIYKI